MKLAKRETSHVFNIRDTGFFNHIKDMGKIRDNHYLLVKLRRSEK
jgi:hypothetical protein